ncbi:MAG TPA: alkaline phosphatase family protein, partial [bacterium]|nr:alkaline phosphatase family protein [bacterium]
LVSLLVVAFCVYFFNPFKPKLFRTKKKIILLGFDGADPRLVDRWWDELPNLQKLARQGAKTTLKSSFPPESPVAWACFAVGGNPGRHGVFDFLRRPAGSYFPSIEAFVEKGYPRFVFRQIPVKMPKAILRRGGTAFWDVLSRAGVPTTLIEVPVTFPPPQLNHGRSLSGLGVPDIRGIQATFHHFVYQNNAASNTEKESTFGGKIIPLRQEGEWYHGHIAGPNDPVLEQERRDLEKQRLDRMLEQYEWQAHLFSLRGGQYVKPEQKTQLADLINININASMAYQSFLHSDDFEERIQRIKDYLIGGKPYEKEGGVTNPSTARERMQKASIECKRLDETIAGLTREITAPVSFRPVDHTAF